MVKFIHTADWQLGKPFSQFEDGLSEQLRQARIEAIDIIARIAKERSIPHVIVAGDVFDQEIPNPKTIRQALDVMSEAKDVNFYLLPGNHDPNRSNGLWSRLGELPANIVPLLEKTPIEIEPDCFLLPSPWSSKNPGVDNTRWMNFTELKDSAIRIGVAHGSIHDFEKESESSQKCVIAAHDRVRDAKLDYLALGDWHGQINISDRVFYSGTPETDSFNSIDPGYILCVEIEAQSAKPVVEKVRTSQYHWIGGEHTVLPETDIAGLFESLFDKDIPPRRTLGRLKIRGSLTASDALNVRTYLSSQSEALSYLDTDFSRLETTYTEDDFDELSLSGSLRETAEKLLVRKNDESYGRKDRQIAERALQLLFSYAGNS